MTHDGEDGPGHDGKQGQRHRQVDRKGGCLCQQVAPQGFEEEQGQQTGRQSNLLSDKRLHRQWFSSRGGLGRRGMERLGAPKVHRPMIRGDAPHAEHHFVAEGERRGRYRLSAGRRGWLSRPLAMPSARSSVCSGAWAWHRRSPGSGGLRGDADNPPAPGFRPLRRSSPCPI